MNSWTVAVIGAGVMGCATALDIARSGHQVFLKDISGAALERAPSVIRREYRSACFLNKGYGDVPLPAIMERITLCADDEEIAQADLIIENTTEDVNGKSDECARLAKICRADAFFAINTSCISITKLASFLADPSRAIGVHLMNPVPVKTMVEVIRGYHTSEQTERGMVEFLQSLGKQPVVIDDLPGFVSNRLSHLLMNEAAFIVQDGIATAEQVDAIIKHGFNHQMGPLETADLIGLDTVVQSLDVLYHSYHDPKFRCCPLLRKMVDAGQWGRKSGRGFYDY
ncbi:3-hydroxyacyl-CoA dehydrogenase family protein [Paenibacillus caui]|uniref:3-hydroxyacyl-CoA dehydrogenase family protein n=1 Tax=Paenibacillus caui TaxID=2873927 RepID=UPI001CA99FB9|nr:3-hydroxyacyl-CoA dehydrogenase family protein [Paenibacillus caui]